MVYLLLVSNNLLYNYIYIIMYPQKYIPKSLSESDKKKQKKQLDKSVKDYKKGIYTERKPLSSFKSKPSSYVIETKKDLGITNVKPETIANKLARTEKRKKELKEGLEKILLKGKGAFYSSGSRPNQSPYSWGLSRVSSVLQGGPARKIDKKIVDKYKIPKL